MGVLDAGASYIINNDGQTNYKGELADVFGCIAMLGSQGCGFEHQLASVLRALGADGAPAPAQNAGFLRPDAFLQIILVSDEDDCSAPPSSDLFDSSSMLVSDPAHPSKFGVWGTTATAGSVSSSCPENILTTGSQVNSCTVSCDEA